jgi:threonine dehydrogenase-like Zn-dependent dehydrogenase
MLCACARDAGAHVVAVGGRPERRALVPEFGAEPGDGTGADVILEAAGTEESWAAALALVRPGGTILAYGTQTETEGRLAFYQLYKKEILLVNARASLPRDMTLAIDLAERGAVELTPLITDRLPLDAAAEAYRLFDSREATKVVLRP